MWPGEYPPEGPPGESPRSSRRCKLQCGRGSIPRKVGWLVRGEFTTDKALQCGRGSIPRKVVPNRSENLLFGLLLQCGRGSIPRKVGLPLPHKPKEAQVASMWPGEYPPEGLHMRGSSFRTGGSFNVAGGVSPGRSASAAAQPALSPALQCGRGSIPRKVAGGVGDGGDGYRASMWPGEYPPEGRPPLQRGHGAALHGFNVAGGVSPGRSLPPRSGEPGAATASMWPGEYPPEGLRRRRSAASSLTGFNVAGGVSPGRSMPMPSGRRPTPPALQCGRGSIPRKVGGKGLADRLPAVASMWPGEYPPEGRAGGRRRCRGWRRFNVAGGVSPGRSWPGAKDPEHPAASMWPGEYPPEGRLRAAASEVAPGGASMWPGEYPPEGRPSGAAASARRRSLQCGRGSIPRKVRPAGGMVEAAGILLQCGRGSIPRKVVVDRLPAHPQAPASMWPGEYPPEGRDLRRRPTEHPPARFNVAGGVSPGRSAVPPDGRRDQLLLQCGRGSIPRKVDASVRNPPPRPPLQCGRGSIPRKVGPGRHRTAARSPGFNVAGGVSPGRSTLNPSAPCSLTPLQCGRGSIPRKVSFGRCAAAFRAWWLQCGRGSIPRKVPRPPASWSATDDGASMWPGEYPPEGRPRSRFRPVARRPGFNVAGGVSPGRSALNCPGANPRRRKASMWPGEYPPEGRGGAGGSHSAAPRFNVAGGVSPGRSRRPRRRPP